MVTGSGLLVGPASLRGFLAGLQEAGTWDLERRLIVRPFPQPLAGQQPNREQWQRLRDEMARISGAVIFIGGLKHTPDGVVDAEGVLDEFERARSSNCYLIPIGASGGAAAKLSQQLIGSSLPSQGTSAQRPSDEELKQLSRVDATVSELVNLTKDILVRFERN